MADLLTEHRIQGLIIQIKQLCTVIAEQTEWLKALDQRVAMLERKDTVSLVKEWADIKEEAEDGSEHD